MAIHKQIFETDIKFIQETVLNRSNYIGESTDISGVLFDAVGEEKRNLFCFDTLAVQEVSLGSLDGVGQTFFEDELVIVTNYNRDH